MPVSKPAVSGSKEKSLIEQSTEDMTFSEDIIPDAGDLAEIEIYKHFRKWRATHKQPRVTDAFRAGYAAAERETRERCARIVDNEPLGYITESEHSKLKKFADRVSAAIRKGEV